MAQDTEARTDTPEYGCITDLSEQQAATAAPAPKGGKATEPAAPAADQE